jgi:hypothetical protein
MGMSPPPVALGPLGALSLAAPMQVDQPSDHQNRQDDDDPKSNE